MECEECTTWRHYRRFRGTAVVVVPAVLDRQRCPFSRDTKRGLVVIDADRVGDGHGRGGTVAPATCDLNVVNDRRSRGTAVVVPAVLDRQRRRHLLWRRGDTTGQLAMDRTVSAMDGTARQWMARLGNGWLGVARCMARRRAMYGSASHDGLDGLGDGTARQARRCTMDWTGSAMGRLGNGRLGVRDVWLGVTRWIGRARKRTAQQLRDEWLGVARGLDLHQWCM